MDRARVVITTALLAGVAAALAFSLWPRRRGADDAPPIEEQTEPKSLATASEEEVADEVEPPPSIARDVEPRADAPPTEAPPSAAVDAAPLAPEVREHAKGMVIPSTAEAMDRKDAKHLREVLAFLKQHRDEGVVTDSDLGAIEAAIACIDQEPEAREEALDFLRFSGNTPLAPNLEKVCGLK